MKRSVWIKNVCAVLIAALAASSLTLFCAGNGKLGRHIVTDEEYSIIERYSKLESVRKLIQDGYYIETEEDSLLLGAIDGMLASLNDPYTYYYTPEEYNERLTEDGKPYTGLGVVLALDGEGEIVFREVYKDCPAYEAGIRDGDVLLKVDGMPVNGENEEGFQEALDLISPENGKRISLTVMRSGKQMEFEIVCREIYRPNVECEILDGGIAYIKILQFSGNAADEFMTVLDSIDTTAVHAMIIDLRNNPGGYLDVVLPMADILMDEGLIVEIEGRSGEKKEYYSDEKSFGLPLAVLINENTASAAEVFAAAVHDHAGGVLIGTCTYGKGIVQSVIVFKEDESAVQYTSACYYTPDGKNINGIGIEPDIFVENTDGEDRQLITAAEVLVNGRE